MQDCIQKQDQVAKSESGDGQAIKPPPHAKYGAMSKKSIENTSCRQLKVEEQRLCPRQWGRRPYCLVTSVIIDFTLTNVTFFHPCTCIFHIFFVCTPSLQMLTQTSASNWTETGVPANRGIHRYSQQGPPRRPLLL